jgi:hypothetical protein
MTQTSVENDFEMVTFINNEFDLRKCCSVCWRQQRTVTEVAERMENLHPEITNDFIIKRLTFN